LIEPRRRCIYNRRLAIASGNILDGMRNKILVLAGSNTPNGGAIDSLRSRCEVVAVDSLDKAIDLLRREHFSAIFSDAQDFLPLERALVSQQANLILNTIGEGVCIVDGEGRCTWMNKKMGAWPPVVHEKIRRSCQEAFDLFSKQISPQTPTEAPAFSRSKRYALNIEEQQYLEMIASPVIHPGGQVMQVVAVVWDATGTRRLQQRIDAVDKAGRELVRLEADNLAKLHVAERLKLLEDKIISFTRDLMHFDHFAIRLLDRKTKKLELVISAGLPQEALSVDLYALPDGNGISGYVASTGRSYICPDVQRDPRYVQGLDSAQSSLTVPLQLNDKIIGIFNIESRQKAAFNEDDRQFAEIFGRYVAIALNVLNLMVVERVSVSHKVADEVNAEVAGPLNDIALDASSLMEEYIGHDDLRHKLQQILDNVGVIRTSLRQVVEGANTVLLGAKNVQTCDDPILCEAEILVADDERNIRDTISDILRKHGAVATVCASGAEAIAELEKRDFDLVLSDINMPDKSGYDVFAAARKRSLTIPVILMTGFGYDPNHSIVRASQEGLQAVLFKPFKVEQLLAEVRKAIQSVAAT
jgi:CheY-like chemotaxis protein/PAS domain-containing protein